MTRFSETMFDFAEDSIKEDKYKDVELRLTDPYGYWRVDGIDGYFTSRVLAEQAIDKMLSDKAKAPVAEKPTKTTKQPASAATKVS